MAGLKSLLKDTAIYGLSSILGRFINYLLVPLQTAKFLASGGEYGIVTNLMAYTALLLVILTYGMETTFFRFANKPEEEAQRVYSTTLMSVGITSLSFVALVFLFLSPLSTAMGYGEHQSYVAAMFTCVAIDAFKCIPMVYLRYQKRPIKFAAIQLLNIVLNIVLNVLYLVVFPLLRFDPCGLYDDHFTLDVGYVFYINLVCSLIVLLFFWKELTGFKYILDKSLLWRMLRYTWPILFLGIAGILNLTADFILFPHLYRGADAYQQLGIYGAASKVAVIMAMITQAFRYAYEPFVFGKVQDKDSKETYAKVMKFFIIFTLLAFLGVIAYMDILRYVVASDYWEGLRVTPIVMIGLILSGVYFNLSFWYKLTDRTIWGAWFSAVGSAVFIGVNVVAVPHYGYIACAWAGVAGYGTAMLLSYFVGQHYYKVDYPLRSIFAYVAITVLLYVAMQYVPATWATWQKISMNTAILLLFVAHFLFYDVCDKHPRAFFQKYKNRLRR